MKIYDISQEVFGCEVYPGDPAPAREQICSIEKGDTYNLTKFSMCAHNGTHIDAPSHFLRDGDTVDMICLEKTVGYCYVANCCGDIDGNSAKELLFRARKANLQAARRILIKGDAVITNDAAEVFAKEGIYLIGVESQTVGPQNAPMQVHLTLLSQGVVLLEGIRLGEVAEGVYFLFSAPLSLGGADGAPCRAILIKE
ncbi:MAG: cyclase [Ruminococcaceae bacterium]|nr:cyclase [Oscillospiraceae bacterium]